jgi:hypothetical protein
MDQVIAKEFTRIARGMLLFEARENESKKPASSGAIRAVIREAASDLDHTWLSVAPEFFVDGAAQPMQRVEAIAWEGGDEHVTACLKRVLLRLADAFGLVQAFLVVGTSGMEYDTTSIAWKQHPGHGVFAGPARKPESVREYEARKRDEGANAVRLRRAGRAQVGIAGGGL